MVILKVVLEDDEEVFSTIDDEDELNVAHELFIQRLSDYDEDDDEDEEDEEDEEDMDL